MAPVRVLIVDDHAEFREVTAALLSRRGFEVVGEAASGASAVESAARLQPDAVLLDVRLGDESGVDVARALAEACPGAAILLTSTTDYGVWEDLMEIRGVRGFVTKSTLAWIDLHAYWPVTPGPSSRSPRAPGR